jgi:hypothetical protein
VCTTTGLSQTYTVRFCAAQEPDTPTAPGTAAPTAAPPVEPARAGGGLSGGAVAAIVISCALVLAVAGYLVYNRKRLNLRFPYTTLN